MISESFYWKSDLLKQAESLRRRMVQKRWPEASFARCEQTIMLGFYSIRRLTEAIKLTDEVSKMSIPVCSYRPTGKRVTLLNLHRIDKLYDLAKPRKKILSLPFLCNQVIHSYIFSLSFNEEGTLSGTLVASDQECSRALLEISVSRIIDAFEKVGSDDVDELTLTFDEKKGDYIHHGYRNVKAPQDSEPG